MKKTVILLAAILAIAACSSKDKEDTGPGTTEANPCATPGATYLTTYTTVSGNCGDIPDNVSNINNDGTITTDSQTSCDKVEQDGCRAHNTGCRSKADNGCDVKNTFTTTFEDDGSSASGISTVTVSCPGGSSCSGTYEYTMTRR